MMNRDPTIHMSNMPREPGGCVPAKAVATAPAPKPGIHIVGKTNLKKNVMLDEIVREGADD